MNNNNKHPPPQFREEPCERLHCLLHAGVECVWVSGKADVGKSCVINWCLQATTRKAVVVVYEGDKQRLETEVIAAKRSKAALIIESRSDPFGEFRYYCHTISLRTYSLRELVDIGLSLLDTDYHQLFLTRMSSTSLLFHNVATPTMATVLYFISNIKNNVEHQKPFILTSTQEDAVELAVWLARAPSMRSKTKNGKVRKRSFERTVRKNEVRSHSDVRTSIGNVLSAQDNNFLRLSLRLNSFGSNYGSVRSLRNSVAKGAIEQTHAGYEPIVADPIRQSNRLCVQELLTADDYPAS